MSMYPLLNEGEFLFVQPSPATLIGDGRVEVAVLDDDLAARERRAHDRRDVVRAVGRVQQRLGARRDVAGEPASVDRRQSERHAHRAFEPLPSRSNSATP